MKIQYELGDVVWIDYGIKAGTVVEIKKRNLIVEDDDGQRFSLPKRKVEPTLVTLWEAKQL